MRPTLQTIYALTFATAILASACARPTAPARVEEPVKLGDASALAEVRERTRGVHKPLGIPRQGSWLASFPEPVQTFEQYVATDPVTVTPERHVLYVRQFGGLSLGETRVAKAAAEFLGLYFGLPVKTLKPSTLEAVPPEARRASRGFGEQVSSVYVNDTFLRPSLPADAVAYLALTGQDLWPGDDLNYVFGSASLRDRVGTYSLARFGDPDNGEDEFKACLLRTLKVMCHETGHMFSMPHCSLYDCAMQGSIDSAELDEQTLDLCPECLAKLCYATGVDPALRFRTLAAFCAREKLAEQKREYEAYLAAVESEGSADWLAADRAEIEREVDRLRVAEQQRDVAAFFAKTDPGFVYRIADGLDLRRDDAVAVLRDAWRRISRVDSLHMTIEYLALGENMAVARVRSDYAKTLAKGAGGRAVSGTDSLREVFVKKNEGWTLAGVEQLRN